MIDESELLDTALESDSRAISPAVRDLVELANELGRVLPARRLSDSARAEIYSRALAMAGAHDWRMPWRRLGVDRRTSAVLGAAAVVTLAGAAIGVALLRGRRQHVPVAA